tara:strand:- start:388 stop:585 length:198 start_codon:yes stop_codon:yes gene_type:complete
MSKLLTHTEVFETELAAMQNTIKELEDSKAKIEVAIAANKILLLGLECNLKASKEGTEISHVVTD